VTQAGPTPSQTAGPFLSIGTEWLADRSVPGAEDTDMVVITGRVIDGAEAPVTDALLEFWQADREGRFPPESGPGWSGFGRALTDLTGRYRLVTVKPGGVEGHAPHVDVSIFARGLMQRLVTRLYFSDEEAANAGDPFLSKLSPGLHSRMIARATESAYLFDVHLQGDEEAVFFSPWFT
jgi:protocatechuate 3,4-dioxygenase, alpha subunit